MENALLLKNYPVQPLFEPMRLISQPDNKLFCNSNGALRVSGMFFDLLEKQFPVNSSYSKMNCRYPVDFAAALSVHVNHLNRCLKDITGKTTSQHIADRIIREARFLLYSSRWNVCEIGYCFGFEEGPHFINFFKKNANMSPNAYRRLMRFEAGNANNL